MLSKTAIFKLQYNFECYITKQVFILNKNMIQDYGSEFSGFTSDFDAEEEKKFQKNLNDEAELRKKPYQ